MSIVTEFVKAFLIPGSFVFLFWGLILGLILLHLRGRAAQWGLRWLTLLAALYWVLSMPFTARLLLVGLSGGYGSVQDVDETREATAVVVLTGGAGTYRAGGKEIACHRSVDLNLIAANKEVVVDDLIGSDHDMVAAAKFCCAGWAGER